MSRLFNFSAGPAALPQPVLQQVREELFDWQGAGMGVMEMSHRGKAFTRIAEQAEADLRELMSIPAHYAVLFMQGGATAQFGVVPQNLLGTRESADYVVTGEWGKKAAQEMGRFGRARVVANSEATRFTELPDPTTWSLDDGAAYLHITTNETIHGVQFQALPAGAADVPLVADASSDFASRPIDVSRFGLIYAGAQKNIGPAGVTVVIVRRDLLRQPLPGTLSVHDYRALDEQGSMLNTPSCFPWYVGGLVFQWLKGQGGLEAIGARNAAKAAKLYAYLDGQDFYSNPVAADCRSLMNVPFFLADPALDADFLKGAEAAGLSGLKGHRLLGGMRASLYNAVPEAAVDALVAYMADFAQRRG